MKQFSNVVAKIKNSDGKFESIPALRGMSSYEVAKEAGFPGTEEDWLTFMFDDGWVAKFQELEVNKANSVDVYTKNETLSADVRAELGLGSNATPMEVFDKMSIPKQWNVNKNVGRINIYPGKFSFGTLDFTQTAPVTGTANIPMINSGEIYLKFRIQARSNTLEGYKYFDSIELLINDTVVKSFPPGSAMLLDSGLIPLSVNRDDVVSIRVIYYRCPIHIESGKTASITTNGVDIDQINLFANIETPYTYIYPLVGTEVDVDDDTLIYNPITIDE